MTIEESERYRKAIIDSAIYWVKGEATIENQEELVVIADHYNVALPLCFKYFVCSTTPLDCKAAGAHKTILKTLAKLAEEIKTYNQ